MHVKIQELKRKSRAVCAARLRKYVVVWLCGLGAKELNRVSFEGALTDANDDATI